MEWLYCRKFGSLSRGNLLWFSLDKARNPYTDERTLLLELFLSLFARAQITQLVADREFVGKTWLEGLTSNGLPFQIRVKENTQVTARGRTQALRE